MRLLLLIVLVNGLAPSLGEAVELVVHYASAGHFAHSEESESDLGNVGKEHGCGPTAHHCRCCASLQAVLPLGHREATSTGLSDGLIPGPEQRVASGIHHRLLRPPIAA